MQFNLNRPRRLRQNPAIRDLVRENVLTPNDFICPLFVMEGKGIKEEIASMPNYYRYSMDSVLAEIHTHIEMGVKCFLLFVKVDESLKDNRGKEASNPNGLMQNVIKEIKNKFPDIILMTDVALDPYSSYGHDGIVENGEIINDDTCEVLAEMSVSHAKAGADFVAPSDMMDGRILTIREALEDEGLINTGIMAYSAKYASSFYGPFRDALDSAPGFGDKKTYQMDPGNSIEAVKEALMDQEEGADVVMVKPGLPYLDIIRAVKEEIDLPVSVYNVSGEYSMIKAAEKMGWIDADQAMMESLIAFKRAGADLIATYFIKDAIKYL